MPSRHRVGQRALGIAVVADLPDALPVGEGRGLDVEQQLFAAASTALTRPKWVLEPSTAKRYSSGRPCAFRPRRSWRDRAGKSGSSSGRRHRPPSAPWDVHRNWLCGCHRRGFRRRIPSPMSRRAPGSGEGEAGRRQASAGRQGRRGIGHAWRFSCFDEIGYSGRGGRSHRTARRPAFRSARPSAVKPSRTTRRS